jgi:hypothetical protein
MLAMKSISRLILSNLRGFTLILLLLTSLIATYLCLCLFGFFSFFSRFDGIQQKKERKNIL